MTEPAFTAAFPTYSPNPMAQGLTKREYAAIHIAAAMAGRNIAYTDATPLSERAVALADAVLKEASQ